MVRKAAKDEYDETVAEVADTTAANLARIHDNAPDLAELIAEERISLPDAIAALNRREAEAAQAAREEHERQERVTREFGKATATLHAILLDPVHDIAADWIPSVNPMADVAGLQALWSPAGLTEIGTRLVHIASRWQSMQDVED